jgi:hypothetical protein
VTRCDADRWAPPEASPWPSQAASLSLHLVVIAVLALLVPPPGGEPKGEVAPGKDLTHNRVPGVGSDGTRAPNGNPTITLKEAAAFGMIGLVTNGALDTSLDPPSVWGRAEAKGGPSKSLVGGAWGEGIGDAFGAGGLGLSGVGEGGGARGEGIGIGDIGTVGHGAGTSNGEGFASGHGNIGGGHRVHTPRDPVCLCGETQVNGRLPPEVIQRIVRQSFGRFRVCYEDAIRRDPALEGRVSVKFVIDREGSVSTAADAGSDLRDEGAVSCIVRAFQSLSFPQPEGGIVTVVYPLTLSADPAP